MSRCFPFPPPGYTRNESRSDALIQSIKLQMETENAKKDRKERKKEKKEKKERKEKKKAEKEKKRKESTTSLSDVAGKKLKTSHSNDAAKKFKLLDAAKEIKPDGKLQKVIESELAERSVITEELGQPAVCSQEPCTSDSSQNSKRKRGSLLPSQPSQNHGEKGTSIRIRIPLRKHRVPEESKQVFQLGSSSGNVKAADPFIQDTRSDSQLQCTTNVETNNQFTGKFDSRKCNPLQNSVLEVAPVPNVVDDENQRMAALYNSLFQIQFPPLTDVGLDSVDQDWLFSSTKPAKAKHVSMKPKNDSYAFQCSKYMGPRAQYLPEVEIYALPYAVPF